MPINQENYSQNQLDLIVQGTLENQEIDTSLGNYIRLTVYDEDTDSFIGRFYSNQNTVDGIPQIEIYTEGGKISVKPNEILEANYVAGGNYKLEFDFLQNVFTSMSDTQAATDPKFIITEISPSRKEIRVIARNEGVEDIPFDETVFIPEFNSVLAPGGSYTYDWVVTNETDKNITINNFTFDEISNADKPSLILRLNKPVPIKFKRLDKINIENEILNTQTQNIIYVSNITSKFAGSGLTPDPSVWSSEVVYEADEAENYNQLIESASFTENTLEDILVKQNEEVNLHVDFSEFKNHILFGSAKKKLENFKIKVGKIQGHLNAISKSMYFDSKGSQSGSYVPTFRQNEFSEIQKIQNTFTPYEKFLYTDNQSNSTASAPGLGVNYAHTSPTTQGGGYKLLTNQDGFKVVHKHIPSADTFVDIFAEQYFAEDTPFFNYTGSLYLSFMMKANKTISSTAGSGDVQNAQFNWANMNRFGHSNSPRIPHEAQYQEYVLRPNVTGSHYQRFILHTSQSHWRPTGSVTLDDNNVHDVDNIPQSNSDWFGKLNTHYSILSSSTQVTTASISASNYNQISLNDNYANLGSTLTSSNTPFYGSVMPAGELFHIYWRAQDFSNTEPTASFITDIKITKNNPQNVLPFSFIYPTGSTEFDNWYNGIYSQASTYDNDNIHSMVKNVPEQVITSSSDVQTFLDMWGEHFDGVRNYIDTYKTFYNRNYNEVYSTPSNLLPILGANLGWELINPFSSSLSDYFSTLTGSLSTVQDITNNTWRKVVNNLVYIYKTKGTQNSLRALLNIYGYPPDLIGVGEYGGSMEETNPVVIDDTYTTFNGLNKSAGNISYVKEPVLYRMMNFRNHDGLKLDWNMNDAIGKAFEFTMIPSVTTNSMSLLQSSGSLTESMWDLQYVPSASSPTIGSLRLRVHYGQNASTGSLLVNTFSGSTDYFKIGNDRMFNVFVGKDGITYRVVVSSKENESINLLTTGSISSINLFAGKNWQGSGSRHALSASNLYVGKNYTGSISDARMWVHAQSASKIKQHTLNPLSVVGNHINSLQNDLVYRFKLNENSLSGSTGRIKDSNPDLIKDFTRNTGFNINYGTYITKVIDTIKLTPRSDGISHKNTNMTTTDIDRGHMTKNLNPKQNSFIPNIDEKSNKKRKLSKTVDFTKSPIDKVDDYITQILADKDVSQYYSKWEDLYQPHYKDLDDLREKIMSGVSIDINRYIDVQARLFNPFIIEAIQSVLPLTAKLEKGVSIKQSILERTKVEYKKAGLVTIPIHEGSIEDIWNISTTITNQYTGLLDDKPNLTLEFVNPSTTEIKTEDMFNYSVDYLTIYNSNDMKLYEDIIDFNIENIDLINFETISLIRQEENFSMSFLKINQSNVMDIYNDFINYTITYNDFPKTTLNENLGKTKYYEFSIVDANNFKNWDIINIYEDFIDYTINYVKIYNTDIIDWPNQSFSMSYLNDLTSIIQDSNYQEFVISYLTIHQFNIDEWRYQTFGMEHLPIYDSNQLMIVTSDNFNYDQLTFVYNQISENKLERWPFDSLNFSYLEISENKLERWPFESLGMSYVTTSENNIDKWPFESFDMSYLKITEKSISDWPHQSLNSTYTEVYEKDLTDWPYEQFTMEFNEVYEKSTKEIQNLNWVSRKESPLKTWGTTIDDTWIMNMHTKGSGSRNYNTGYYNDDVLNYMIMDMEHLSGSKKRKLCSGELGAVSDETRKCTDPDNYCDASDWRCITNRFIYDDGRNQDIYQSYFGDSGGTAPIKGRPIGRTTFIATASNGDLIYPSNHHIHYHTTKNQSRYLYYDKTPADVLMIGDNNVFYTGSFGGQIQFDGDLYPRVQVYTQEVEGSDTKNILKVERTGDRPTTDKNVSAKKVKTRGGNYGEDDTASGPGGV